MKKVLFILIFSLILLPVVCFAEQIDINSATLSQLDEIVHVGAKTAQKIIDARPFSSVQDLSRVKGIGDGKYLQDIIDQGWACVNCQTQLTQPTPPTTPSQIPTPEATPIPTQTPTLATNYPTGVVINEILPNPTGPDQTNEWIELYNSNNFDVDLSGWQLQDTAGTITTYTIPQSTIISANGFLVFKRPDTQIMLNNDADGLNLLTPDAKIVDSVDFASAPLNESYNKADSGWHWSTTLTPGVVNIITAAEMAPTNTTILPKPQNSVKNNSVKQGLADLSLSAQAGQTTETNQDNSTTNPWFLFFTVLVTTIILALIVLFIKLRFKSVTETKP